MRKPALKTLDATYRARALPPGSARHWSWLFAAEELRAPLLGIYALGAELQALMDPSAETSAAHLKLAWWQDEMQRLVGGSAVHPISVYLAALPRAASIDFSPLLASVNAAAAQVSGVPLEHSADLEPHARALSGAPLLLASRLAGEAPDETALSQCTSALASADYLARAIGGYRRAAHSGRMPFAIEELMAEGLENDDLSADPAPARLQDYLDRLRGRALRLYESSAQHLPPGQRAGQRHLLVLAALGSIRLNDAASPLEGRRFKDMLLAWTTARRAQRKIRSST